MVVGLRCHRKQQKIEWMLEEFSVLETLFNIVIKKEIKRPSGFEGLSRFYVMLSSSRFIKQWVTLELYNELLLEKFSTHVTPLNGDKDYPDLQCVYCKGEWSSKL
jgi:hypothetical protein